MEMGLAVFFVLCSIVGCAVQNEVILQEDRPSVSVRLYDEATLECCFKNAPSTFVWVKYNATQNITIIDKIRYFEKIGEQQCGTLTFESVQLIDTGLYRCYLNQTKIFSPGTYMQVYKPMEKLIDMNESTKNMILTAEGILLLLCVLVPSAMLLFKSKSLHELEMKKAKREEENIYEGLNLEDCCSTYDQIERSQAQGPYQDVGNMMEAGEIQLEKP